jgi:hypothetical protein
MRQEREIIVAKFAVMEGNVVINIILADDISDAEAVTGKTCIEYTDENPASIDSTYDEDAKLFYPLPPVEVIEEV